ncbi:MAG: hypothetical protein KC501_25605, partial [Myxococcales bacterium]|nr:hypothetical protein [Myxococcales bacterium]
LRYEHGDRLVEQDFELTQHAQMEEWAVRLEDPEARSWQYQATLIQTTGGIETTGWIDGHDELLVLGFDAVDVIPVQVSWLVPPPAGGLVAVKIDLAYDDDRLNVHWQHSELIRQGHSGSFTWPIAIRDRRVRSYRYRVTEFRAAVPSEGEWKTSDSTMLVLLPGM